MLDALRRENIQIIPYEACNGTIYKIGTLLLPGKFLKSASFESKMD